MYIYIYIYIHMYIAFNPIIYVLICLRCSLNVVYMYHTWCMYMYITIYKCATMCPSLSWGRCQQEPGHNNFYPMYIQSISKIQIYMGPLPGPARRIRAGPSPGLRRPRAGYGAALGSGLPGASGPGEAGGPDMFGCIFIWIANKLYRRRPQTDIYRNTWLYGNTW